MKGAADYMAPKTTSFPILSHIKEGVDTRLVKDIKFFSTVHFLAIQKLDENWIKVACYNDEIAAIVDIDKSKTFRIVIDYDDPNGLKSIICQINENLLQCSKEK